MDRIESTGAETGDEFERRYQAALDEMTDPVGGFDFWRERINDTMFPILGSSHRHIVKLLRKPYGDEDDLIRLLAAVCRSDPLMTANLFRLSNEGESPLPPVTTIDCAVKRVGTQRVVQYAQMMSSIEDHLEGFPGAIVRVTQIVRRRVDAAKAAAAKLRADPEQAQAAYARALLAEVGDLFLFTCAPQFNEPAHLSLTHAPSEIAEAQTAIFGFDRDEMTRMLNDTWRIFAGYPAT